jgi:hypothetical protein
LLLVLLLVLLLLVEPSLVVLDGDAEEWCLVGGLGDDVEVDDAFEGGSKRLFLELLLVLVVFMTLLTRWKW